MSTFVVFLVVIIFPLYINGNCSYGFKYQYSMISSDDTYAGSTNDVGLLKNQKFASNNCQYYVTWTDSFTITNVLYTLIVYDAVNNVRLYENTQSMSKCINNCIRKTRVRLKDDGSLTAERQMDSQGQAEWLTPHPMYNYTIKRDIGVYYAILTDDAELYIADMNFNKLETIYKLTDSPTHVTNNPTMMPTHTPTRSPTHCVYPTKYVHSMISSNQSYGGATNNLGLSNNERLASDNCQYYVTWTDSIGNNVKYKLIVYDAVNNVRIYENTQSIQRCFNNCIRKTRVRMKDNGALTAERRMTSQSNFLVNHPMYNYSVIREINTYHLVLSNDAELYVADANFNKIETIFILTNNPTLNPTIATYSPTILTNNPTNYPTNNPSIDQTIDPTGSPTKVPSVSILNPTTDPSPNPTTSPSQFPTQIPSIYPTSIPTMNPSNIPTGNPITNPTISPAISELASASKEDSNSTLVIIILVLSGTIIVIVGLFLFISHKNKTKDKLTKVQLETMSNKLAKLEAQTTSYTAPEGNALPHGVTNDYSTEGMDSTNEELYNEQVSEIYNDLNTPHSDPPIPNNSEDIGTYFANNSNNEIITQNDTIIAQEYQENQMDIQEVTRGNDIQTPGNNK